MNNQTTSIRNAIWKSVFTDGATITTKDIARATKSVGRDVYRQMKALEREKVVEVIPPDEDNRYCRMCLHPRLNWLNKENA